MKNKLFTTLVVFGLSFIAWNCSGDPASPIPNQNPAYNPTESSSFETVPVIVSSSSIVAAPISSATAPVVSSSSVTTPVIASSSSVAAPVSSATVASSSQVAQPVSSSSKAADSGKIGSITYTGSLTQTVSRGGSITTIKFSGLKSKPSRQSWNIWSINDSDCKYDESAKTFTISGTVHKDVGTGKFEETWIMDGTAITLTVNVTDGSSTGKSSSSKKVASSSSQQTQQPKSSSSKVNSSAASTNPGTSVELKYISGGRSGKGFASRYWDCCKPHCSWPEHAHGNYSKQCTNKGTKESTDWGGGSVCSGGALMTCTSQIPIIVNDNLAYAFAAVPAADGGSCGKCYALQFDGKGKYESKINHQKLKNKILVVMATNIGSDVQQGQFDVMIPGGGVGLFNGCASMGWGNQGSQYGGLLSDGCEGDSKGYTARKDCLAAKCEKAFANDAKAKEGCMFLATWMEAAGNPTHEYKEVECPAGLKAQY